MRRGSTKTRKPRKTRKAWKRALSCPSFPTFPRFPSFRFTTLLFNSTKRKLGNLGNLGNLGQQKYFRVFRGFQDFQVFVKEHFEQYGQTEASLHNPLPLLINFLDLLLQKPLFFVTIWRFQDYMTSKFICTPLFRGPVHLPLESTSQTKCPRYTKVRYCGNAFVDVLGMC